MKKKDKVQIRLFGVTIICDKCETRSFLYANEVTFSATVHECELCGDHGEVLLRAKCPHCSFTYVTVLNEW